MKFKTSIEVDGQVKGKEIHVNGTRKDNVWDSKAEGNHNHTPASIGASKRTVSATEPANPDVGDFWIQP